MTNTTRRIFVTGANGFVGHWVTSLASQVCGARASVLALENVDGKLDISDREAVMRAVEAARPDAIIHLAAIASPADVRDSAELAWGVNVGGCVHLADALLTHAPEASLIFASSSEVYGVARAGDPAPGPASRLRPHSVYGVTKAAAELALEQKRYDGLKLAVLRPFNHTGPGQTPKYVVPAFARQIAMIEAGELEPIVRHGNLDDVKSFLDVRDVAAAYLRAAMLPAEQLPPEPVNLCGEQISISDILHRLIRMARVDITTEADPSRMRPSTRVALASDNGPAESLLGWHRQYDLDTTISDVLSDWRAHS